MTTPISRLERATTFSAASSAVIGLAAWRDAMQGSAAISLGTLKIAAGAGGGRGLVQAERMVGENIAAGLVLQTLALSTGLTTPTEG